MPKEAKFKPGDVVRLQHNSCGMSHKDRELTGLVGVVTGEPVMGCTSSPSYPVWWFGPKPTYDLCHNSYNADSGDFWHEVALKHIEEEEEGAGRPIA